MPPEAVAAAIYTAVQKRRRILIPGVGHKLMATLGYLLPHVVARSMKRILLDKMRRPSTSTQPD